MHTGLCYEDLMPSYCMSSCHGPLYLWDVECVKASLQCLISTANKEFQCWGPVLYSSHCTSLQFLRLLVSAVVSGQKVILRRKKVWFSARWWSHMTSLLGRDALDQFPIASIWRPRVGGSVEYDRIRSALFVQSRPLGIIGSVDILCMTILCRCLDFECLILSINSHIPLLPVLSLSGSVIG